MLPESAKLNVRRLAALDMHGARGTRRRRRIILAEFAFGMVGGVAIGAWVLSWGTAVGVILGICIRRYTRAQVWVLVPFWVVGLALAQSRRGIS